LLRIADETVAEISPTAKIPLVEFPAAVPRADATLELATPVAVLVSQAYVYLFLVRLGVVVARPSAKIPLVEFPAAAPCMESPLAVAPVVEVSDAYVYLFLVLLGAQPPQECRPRAKMPRVLFPAAEPHLLGRDAAVAPAEVQLEYVYLLRVHTPPHATHPRAKIPRVLFPAAAPNLAAEEADPTPVAVDTSVAYVYLFLTADMQYAACPNAKIPLFPSFKQQEEPAANNPYPLADAAPLVDISDIYCPYANLSCDANMVNAALPVFIIV
jgi:hypothetical protein